MNNSDFNIQPVFLGDGPMGSLVSQFDPLTLNFYNHAVEYYTNTALAEQGFRSLGSSRHDAAAHEAGHAVWYAANGITVTSIKVEPKPWPVPVPKELGKEYWTGLTVTNEPLIAFGLSSSVDELIQIAQSFIAGGAGELLLRGDKFRKGSAADERAMAQVLYAMVDAKRVAEGSIDFSMLDLNAVFECIGQAQMIAMSGVFKVMVSNKPTLNRVSAALLRHDQIDRDLASELLKGVKQVTCAVTA